MQLKYNSPRQRFEFVCLKADKDTAKQAGFRWDPECFVWYASKYSRPWELAQYADDEAKAKLAELHADAPKPLSEDEKQQVLADSYAANASIQIPAPAGLAYYEFQKAGIAFALNRPNCLIADDMGVGKSIQAIGVINAKPELKRVLIIVPAGLRLNWMKECKKWLVRPTPLFRNDTGLECDGISILGYEEAVKYAMKISSNEWDLIIADEAHYLKNHKAKRTKAILSFPTKAWLFLTGSPMLNRPVEIFTIVKKLDKHGLGADWMAFVQRYCNAFRNRWGWDVSGASNVDELNQKLRLAGMIRRMKSEVLSELPDKCRSIIPLEPDSITKKIIDEQMRKALDAKKAIRRARQMERKGKAEFAEDIQKLREGAGVKFEEIANIRHELAVAKIPQVVDFIVDAVTGGPVICFAHHHDVVSGLSKGLAEKGITFAAIVGGMADKAKDAIVENFQAGKLDVVICSIKAAGVGLTLTRSSHVIFAELDWSPLIMHQAEDRANRIGQKNSVQADWLVLDGSLEAKMAKTLLSKVEVISRAMGDNLPPPPAPAFLTSPCPPRPPVSKPAEPIPVEKLYSHPMAPEAPECPELPAQPEPSTVEPVAVHPVQSPAQKGVSWKEEMEAAKKAIPKGIYIVDYHGKPTEFRVRVSRTSGSLYVEKGPGPERFYMGFNREVLQILANTDLDAAGKKYADATGQCWKCGRALTNELSILLGIGPECGKEEHAAHGE